MADARPAPARRPRIGVLALQGDVREHVDALGAAGADAVRVRTATELAGVQGLVLPGGESTTIGRLLDVFSLLEPLQQAVAAGMPVYGSCAGMILLAAEVLDGRPDQRLVGGLDVVVRRNAFGRQVDSFERDLEVEGIAGGPVHAVFIRAPWVERAGPRVEVLAEVDGHPVAVRQGPLLATAFHPELGSPQAGVRAGSGRGAADGRIHEMFVRQVKEAAA